METGKLGTKILGCPKPTKPMVSRLPKPASKLQRYASDRHGNIKNPKIIWVTLKQTADPKIHKRAQSDGLGVMLEIYVFCPKPRGSVHICVKRGKKVRII